MAKTELIDERVSVNQCRLAVEALSAHELKKEQKLQESELLPGKEPNIWLNITVKKIPSGHKFKPAKIPIAHPLIDPRTTPICLITKDPQREYKDLLETHKIKFISRVVGVEKLKGKFKPFEARRMLLKENGLFLADERIIPLLPKLLGVKWFEAKKQPIPVCLTRKDLKGELERAVSSTYMNQNRGTCTSVKIATLSQTPTQILANLKLALPAIATRISGGWENIQSLHIKTNSSVSLPIWTCNLDENEGGRWTGLTAKADGENSDAASDVDEENGVSDEPKDLNQGKGKKRIQEVEDVEKPKKKAKGAKGQPVVEPTPEIQTRPAVESAAKAMSKKKGTAVDAQKPASAPIPPASPAVIETKTQKKKKPRLSTGLPPDPLPIPQPTEEPLPKQKKEKKAAELVAPVSDKSVVKGKKGKTSEKSVEAPAEETAAIPMTKDELKQKRSGAPGEKKKSKVNSVVGKSAKDRVLGKKAAQ